MPDAATYSARLGCDNCGHAEVYTLPRKSIITGYDREERIPSSYRLVNSRDETLVNCRHCKLPHLVVLWWKEEEVEVPHG